MTGDARPFDPMPGVWRARGYGWELSVGADFSFVVRDVGPGASGVVDQGPPGSLGEAFDPLVFENPASVRLKHRGDVTAYWFDRVVAPEGQAAAPSADAETNFEALWRIFQEHYAFFGLRGADWRAAYKEHRPRLTAASSEDDLWRVIADLITPLGDAHVSLAAPGRLMDVTSPVRDRKAMVQRVFGVPPWSRDRQAYTDGVRAGFNELFLGGRGRTTANNMMLYGEAAPGVGYVALFGEFGHAATARSSAALDLPRPRLEAASFLADEIAGLRRGLDEVVAALASMRAMIIDARLNYGGYDRLALDFAGRFVDRSRPAFRKKTQVRGEVVAEQLIEVAPSGRSLAHLPAVLLTSRQTASAGEILTFALSASPNVTRVGERTLGILSDNLYKRLPNGWELSLSNEIYEDPAGALWEASGIPPHVEAPVYDPADLRGGLGRTVAAALDQLRTRRD